MVIREPFNDLNVELCSLDLWFVHEVVGYDLLELSALCMLSQKLLIVSKLPKVRYHDAV